MSLSGVVEQDEASIDINIKPKQLPRVFQISVLKLEELAQFISVAPLELRPLLLLLFRCANLAGDELDDTGDINMHASILLCCYGLF